MKLTIYRILSFLLAPVAIIFIICFFLFIRAAFDNPAMLLPLFMIACISIYSLTSLNFLIRGIDSKKLIGKAAKDWIRVNAFVSIVFSLLMISQCIIFLMHPEMLQQLADQAKQNAGTDLKMSQAALINYMRITSCFFLVYSIVLFVHILFSFQYIKEYSFVFRYEEK